MAKKKKIDIVTENALLDEGLSVIKDFLIESNHIENIYNLTADMDALDAWNYIIEKDQLTPEIVLETHRILMKNLEPRIAGKFRDCDVYIGGKRKYFISESLLKSELNDILVQINEIEKSGLGDKPAIPTDHNKCVTQHIAFEGLHPFEDGNGRTGRILYNWQRVKLGLPIHVIHADWPDQKGEQATYYKWFK